MELSMILLCSSISSLIERGFQHFMLFNGCTLFLFLMSYYLSLLWHYLTPLFITLQPCLIYSHLITPILQHPWMKTCSMTGILFATSFFQIICLGCVSQMELSHTPLFLYNQDHFVFLLILIKTWEYVTDYPFISFLDSLKLNE